MKKLIGLVVSAAILALLYTSIDTGGIWAAAQLTRPAWLIAGLLFVIPLTLLTAWRFTILVGGLQVGFLESNRLILAASTLNMILPSKLGDLAKAHVLSRRHGMKASLSFSVVVLEKAVDMISLLIWGVFGILVVGMKQPAMLWLLLPVAGGLVLIAVLISPSRFLPRILTLLGDLMPARPKRGLEAFATSWQEMLAWFWDHARRALGVLLLSFIIWGAHLFQFWVFCHALNGEVPLLENAAFATLSILVGLLPFTFAGVGTRDAAIVFFYAPYLPPQQAALLGILATLRYIIPAIAGAPFVADFAGLTDRARGSSERDEVKSR
ncbi:uncharacterized protein (TIRG00374 family) [Pararhizobium capsulatum DSM 1112]|uniref:Uncharacterized protein (TIRG00374 family) n=1 Tax=Pararhizobium capsulatum DSM 1112 TaxID=1121113 RepID=A0ABU0BXJ0_9HYPH|nr:lysylphosphatidylglycerol synthase transmembrane domain-containing protein [Pararhizobium capsulatum]MDQ0322969.1 uncharacterized protein (TIRG00374 family) [Pararhizobium capsulatum DSM 1112]